MRAQTVSESAVVERLAKWICAVTYEDIPERVLQKARYQTLNVLASLHAGVHTEAGRSVLRAVEKWKKPGQCTVIPTGEKMALHEAVLVNSAFSMALDYDDYLYMGHTGHSAVLGSWAVCEEERLSTKQMIVAQTIANEIGARVGASAVLGPQNGQAWSFIHAVEGAALAAKLYGLDEEQTAHALAIALYQPTFTLWPGFMGPQSKVLTAAGPTITGIQAAQFAREGLTGAREIFEHPRKGFWKFFTFVPLPYMLTGFGSAWFSDTLTYKKYPGCAYIDTTMDALFLVLDEFRRKNGRALRAEDVKHLDVEASMMTIEMDNLSAEHVGDFAKLSPVNINFSIPYNTALGIIAGKHTAAELSQEFLDTHERTIRVLAARTELHHSWEMTSKVAAAFDGVLGKNGVARRLSAGDLLKVIRGYQGELGGKKKNSIDVKALFTKNRGGFLRQIRALRKRASKEGNGSAVKAGDLAGADFTRFRTSFPARVTVETFAGEKFSARQDVPWGAPGQERYFETVEEKWRTEAKVNLPDNQIENALSRVRDFEQTRLDEIAKYVCKSTP